VLSVVVLTLNEVKHIRDCLESVRAFADEMLVFDSGSTDSTVEIARQAGARVETRPFDNYAAQRNAALDAAHGDWVFFIDADERADAAVGEEIRSDISRIESTNSNEVLFWIPRKNYIFGKWIQHTGWSPDYQPRVLRKTKAQFDPSRPVHELVLADGGELYLKQPLIHYNYETLAQFRAKQQRYTQFESREMFEQNIHPRLRSYISMPAREFVRRFISLEGYRDGLHGLALSSLMAYYACWRQVWLAHMWYN
jgi:glycosyltransferase involved in cell wall biosynthesis